MKDTFEDLLEQFEREFAKGSAPDIRQFLQQQATADHRLLTELVHTELELRLRTGEQARVEGYLDRFPELVGDRTTIRDLVRTEYNVRRNFEPGGCRLEEYVIRFPEMRQSLVDEFLNSSIATSGSSVGESTLTKTDRSDARRFSDQTARFRKQQLHEQGGLGNVWLAADAELDRDVVLKEIKSKYVNSATHRARFAREAKITGSLKHPGIAPVYGRGFSDDGSPFFAMQFIQGKNLRHSIKQFHARQAVDHDSSSRSFNRLIQHFVDVCDTIEYAHSQGVIHRDIKPENIMVGQFGETYLIDWGLACSTVSRRSEAAADQKSGMTPSEVTESTSFDGEAKDALSQAGQTIGSPAFMSPEQAVGDIEQITVATDVYGLGATLLSLLIGTDNPNRLVKNNSKRNGPSRFGVPPQLKPLVAICLKAMATNPSDRYQSARQLREDVENFQLDKQVTSHKESVFDRLSRWLRRNRMLLAAAIMTLALVSIVSAVAAFWINTERNNAVAARESESELREQAESAKQLETKARMKAEKRTDQLTNVLGIFADAVAGSDDAGLQINPEMVTSKQIVTMLEERIEENNDPIVRTLLNAVVARSSRASGNYEQSVAIYKSAIELLDQEQIAITDPLYADLLSGLSTTLLATGATDEAAGYIEQVKAAYRQNEEPLEKHYFRILMSEVKVAIRKQNLDRALELANEARSVGERVFTNSPTNSNLMWADFVRADVYRLQGESESAAELFEQIVTAQQQKQGLHGLGIASAVQLSELRRNEDPKRSLELIEQARIDSAIHFGDDHPDTINIDSRFGRMLASMPDEASQVRGVKILESCHQRMTERLGINSREAMGSTVLLTETLLSFEDESRSQQVVEVLNQVLGELAQSADQGANFTAYVASFHDRLAIAYSQLGSHDKARVAGEQAVALAVEEFGEDSPVVAKLTQKHKDRISKAENK